MDKAPNVFYGELVEMPHDEERTNFELEVEAMKEQTRLQIEEAAWFLAEKRGFAPGLALDDWLRAEAEIEKRNSGK
jgi:Protein of unknown function (DUF2934)